FEQRGFYLAVFKDAERILGHRPIVAGPLDGIFKRGVAIYYGDGRLEIRIPLLAILAHAVPEGPLLGIAAAEGEEDLQRHLALAEIIADRLAKRLLLGRIVERVITELEGEAEIAAVAFERLRFRFRPVGNHRANFAGRCKKRRCL